jgi:Icc-related predicted phosphoesterase
MPWRMKQPAKECIVTWGNHDFCGELCASGVTHLTRHTDDAATHIVIDDVIEISGLKIWMSPWSNAFRTPSGWAFMEPHQILAPIYESIPDDVDIIVSHGPMKGYGDSCPPLRAPLETPKEKWSHVGSEELRDAVDRVQPKALICGHIHTARGVYNRGETTIYNVSAADYYVKLRPDAAVEILV